MKIFDHVKFDVLDFDLKSETTERGRVYKIPNGESYPSITTILSGMHKDVIDKWKNRIGLDEANKISNLASSRGTKLHFACEKYLLNEMSDIKLFSMWPDTKALFRTLRPHFDSSLNNIVCLEQALYSNVLKVAGRVDCIAEWNGKLSVIDFKTSTRLKEEDHIQNYFMQCTAYTQMFEELTGNPIEQIVIVIAVEESDIPQIFVRDTADYKQATFDYINKYHLTHS